MSIGERLRTIREKQGLSQHDVEQRTGIRGTYISRIENGHAVPSVANLEEIASALGVPIHELFYDSSSPPRNPSYLTAGDIAESHHHESWIRFFFSRLVSKNKRKRI